MGDQHARLMVDEPNDPAVAAEGRDDAVRDQEGDKGDGRGSERGVRRGCAPTDDGAYRDRDRKVECAELCKRTPFRQAQADDRYREKQNGFNRHPSQTACSTYQFTHMGHPLRSLPARCSPLYPGCHFAHA